MKTTAMRLSFLAAVLVVAFGDQLLDVSNLPFDDWEAGRVGDVLNCQFSSTKLQAARADMAGLSVGTTVVFAGGYSPSGGLSSAVDSFNFTDLNQDQVQTNLPEARRGLTAGAVGSLVLFTGGQDSNGEGTNTIWTFNTASGTWFDILLPNGLVGYGQATVAVALDSVFVLAGGMYKEDSTYSYSQKIISLDLDNDEWRLGAMTRARAELSVVEVGDFAYLAGGVNANGVQGLIERFNITEPMNGNVEIWGDLAFRRRKMGAAGISVDGRDYILFAGGFTSEGASAIVEIFDVSVPDQPKVTYGNLTAPRGNFDVATLDGTVIFGPGEDIDGLAVGIVDVLNVTTMTWGSYALNYPRTESSVVAMAPDTFYVAGGINQSGAASNRIDLIDCDHTPAPTQAPNCPEPSNDNPCQRGDKYCKRKVNTRSYCLFWSAEPTCWGTDNVIPCDCACGNPANIPTEPPSDMWVPSDVVDDAPVELDSEALKTWENARLVNRLTKVSPKKKKLRVVQI